MKKKILCGLLIFGLFIFTGCNTQNQDIVSSLTKKISKINGYHITGTLEVTNNETTYQYDINVDYQKDEKYRVSLKNKTNDHEQIILKNAEGVFVLTPSLNKSFKFQSEWPYNNSQSYLYQTILEDIKNDSKKTVETKNDGYIIQTSVNYSNNKDLVSQKIYLDKKANITKVEVLNRNGIVKIRMNYTQTDLNKKFDKNYFDLSQNMKLTEQKTETKKTSLEIDDIVYPLYLPDNTYLESQETIATDEGDRVILTFTGDSPFTLIEEKVNASEDTVIVPVYGDLEFINDSIGNISDQSASWISDGIEYYAVSNTLEKEELLQMVNSMNTIPVGKQSITILYFLILCYNDFGDIMEEKYNLKSLIISIFIILAVLITFYFITIFITEHKIEDNEETKSDAVIDYDTILVSEIYKQNRDSYYVLASFSKDENISSYQSNLSTYAKQENALKVYEVDLDSAFNKNYISEATDLTAKYPVFSETTLLKIENGVITEHYQGSDISTFLKTLVKE